MTKPFDCARSIYEEIKVHVYGPLGSETPSCAEALSTANLIAELQARVNALEAALRAIASPSSNRTHLGLNQDAPASPDSLVKQVSKAIAFDFVQTIEEEDAGHAILAVANWLDQQELHTAATRLRQEVEG